MVEAGERESYRLLWANVREQFAPNFRAEIDRGVSAEVRLVETLPAAAGDPIRIAAIDRLRIGALLMLLQPLREPLHPLMRRPLSSESCSLGSQLWRCSRLGTTEAERRLRPSCSNGLDLAQRSFPSAMEIGSGTHTTRWLSDSGPPELRSIARIETETYAS